MIRSMTAFARREQTTDWGHIAWELRSVNHRYLEVAVRLPDPLRVLEPLVRERVSQRLSRGKVECSLRLNLPPGTLSRFSLNRPLAEQVLAMAGELQSLLPGEERLGLAELLRWPGVVVEEEPDLASLQGLVLESLEGALDELIAHREREGERIDSFLRQRARALVVEVERVRARRPEVLQRIRDKLMQRLADLPVEADPGRLEQEMALLSQRLDVDEELDRLTAHLSELETTLKRTEPVGRRLDFLMQELNREANTLSSKSNDTETTRAGVEAKVLIEQMREQVQNIE